jgi:prophage regulatory protein
MAQTAIIRLPKVRARTGLSRSEIYRRESLGEFPKRVTLGPRSRCVGWVADEIQAWIEARIHESRKVKYKQ